MQFSVLTLFPDIITSYCHETILGRAQGEGRMKVRTINPRDFTSDKHRSVDDSPYGGGAGMVMKPEPIFKALESIQGLTSAISKQTTALGKIRSVLKSVVRSSKSKKTILLSPRGRQFDQALAAKWSKLDELILVSGRYEGVDQRVADYMVDEEVSVGPYVLAGGELGALIIIEAVSRLIPGVLGNPDSLLEETFGWTSDFRLQTSVLERKKNKAYEVRSPKSEVQREYPQYTKPVEFMGHRVPDVLLSGNHEEIKKWRNKNMK